MVSRLALLLIFVGLVPVVSAAAANPRRNVLPSPGVCNRAGWLTVTAGATNPSQQREPPQVFALTARSNPDALTPFDVFDGLPKLDGASALIWATTIGRSGDPTSPFKRRSWPPRLADFRLDHGWEGQSLPRIQQRLLEIAVGGWDVDVRVYFGTQRPSAALRASVQAELNCLTPPRT